MNEITEKKTTLLTNETFTLLRLAQRRIQEETEISPSMRLLINDVINERNINKTVDQLIGKINENPLFSVQTDNINHDANTASSSNI